jgi:hypothetical protein
MNEGVLVEGANRAEVAPFEERTHVYATEWHSLRTSHHNVLLEGTPAATAAALFFLKPYLRNPVVWLRPGMPLLLQQGRDCTLVLPDVAALTPAEQEHISSWLADPRQRLQTVAMSITSLHSHVTSGRFDETLYYHLNILLLRVDAHS